MNRYNCLFLAVILTGSIPAGFAAAPINSAWEKSVVNLETTRKQYDYLMPWAKRTENFRKCGVVIGSNEVLTTAEYLNDATLIRLQKNGRGKWWNAHIAWIDYHANLAIVNTDDQNFWDGLKPVILAQSVPNNGPVQIARWSSGNLDLRKGEINQVVVKRAKLSFIDYMQVDVDSEINAAGWSESIIRGDSLLGLAAGHGANNLTIIPSPFIGWMLKARKEPSYRGLGFFDFIWQKAENPVTHQFLKRTGDPKGVLVVDFVLKNGPERVLKQNDIILKIDGFDIDTEGYYADPEYGNLSLENLATRRKLAGDSVSLSVWRDGHSLDLNYVLPTADYKIDLVPKALFDQEPEYILMAGLVFQPLSEPYLRTWGSDWRRKAPFRLTYYTLDKSTQERPNRVVLSLVLPDDLTLGYQDYRFFCLDKVNHRPISRLADLQEAWGSPVNGYHIIEFATGDGVKKLVLNAQECPSATKRTMQRYGIERDRLLLVERR